MLFIAFSTGFYLTTVNSARTGITVLASSSVLSRALKICLPLPFTHGAWTITLQKRMNLPVSVSKVSAKPSFVNLENFSVEDKCSTYCYLQFFTPVILKISVVIHPTDCDTFPLNYVLMSKNNLKQISLFVLITCLQDNIMEFQEEAGC